MPGSATNHCCCHCCSHCWSLAASFFSLRRASSRLTTICGCLAVYTRCDKISCFGKAFIRSGLLLLCFCLRLSALTLRLASLAQGKVQLVQVWHVQLASLPLEQDASCSCEAFLGSSAARRPDANGNSISFVKRKNCNDTCAASAGYSHSERALTQRVYVKQLCALLLSSD